MNKLKEIELLTKPLNTTGPWCMVFLYHQNGSIVVKGWRRDVKEHIEKSFPYSFGYTLFFQKGRSCGRWETFVPDKSSISFRILRLDNSSEEFSAPFGRNRKKKHFYIYARNQKTNKRSSIVLRRMPRKWIPEFTNILNEVKPEPFQ